MPEMPSRHGGFQNHLETAADASLKTFRETKITASREAIFGWRFFPTGSAQLASRLGADLSSESLRRA